MQHLFKKPGYVYWTRRKTRTFTNVHLFIIDYLNMDYYSDKTLHAIYIMHTDFNPQSTYIIFYLNECKQKQVYSL